MSTDNDLSLTTEDNRSAAYAALEAAVRAAVPAGTSINDDGGAQLDVAVQRGDRSVVTVTLAYTEHGRYDGITIGGINTLGYADGSWQIRCTLEQIQVFLPAALSPALGGPQRHFPTGTAENEDWE